MKYLLLVAIGFFPFLSSAATYHYVNSAGITATVEAPDANTAIMTAPNIAADSGVALDQGLIEPGEVVGFGYSANVQSDANTNMSAGMNGGTTYHYVTQAGVTDTVIAPDANTAIMTAPNIAVHSGVAIDQGIIEPGMDVPSVQ